MDLGLRALILLLYIQDSMSLYFMDLGLRALISMASHLLCFETPRFTLRY
jgi:hypothetical protein